MGVQRQVRRRRSEKVGNLKCVLEEMGRGIWVCRQT